MEDINMSGGEIKVTELGRYGIFPQSVELIPKEKPHVNLYGEKGAEYQPCKIIVNYLPNTLPDEELHALTAEFGEIISCRHIPFTGYGFVEYERQESANRACEVLDGTDFMGNQIKVSLARVNTDTKKTTLHVTGIPIDWSIEEFLVYFEIFGKVLSVKVLRDGTTKISRGIGFVVYASRYTAESVVEFLHNKVEPDVGAPKWKINFATGNLVRRRRENEVEEPVSAPAIMGWKSDVREQIMNDARHEGMRRGLFGSELRDERDIKDKRVYELEFVHVGGDATLGFVLTLFKNYKSFKGLEIIKDGEKGGPGKIVVKFDEAEEAMEACASLNGQPTSGGGFLHVEIRSNKKRN